MSDIESDQEGGGKKRRYKITKDKKGNRFIRTGKRKIKAPANIRTPDLIKWILSEFGPLPRSRRRKKRTPRKKPEQPLPLQIVAQDPLELSPQQAADEGVRNYINTERERAGREKLEAPAGPGLPATIDEEAQEKRQAEREAKRAARIEREAKLTEAKEAAEAKAGTHEAKLRAEAETATIRRLNDSYTIDQLRAKIPSANATATEKKAVKRINKLDLTKWLLAHDQADVTQKYAEFQTEELARLVGAGKVDPEGKGMTTDDINEVMAPSHYLGTIARNEWNLLAPAPHTGKSGWIMNTDPNTKGGTHWVAFLMDLDRHTIEYYNSFADDIPTDLLATLKEFIAKNNPTKQYLKLKVNRVIDQDANSTNCGWFCCRFLIDRFRGRPWKEVTKFDDHVHGEEEVEKFKKQHGGEYAEYL